MPPGSPGGIAEHRNLSRRFTRRGRRGGAPHRHCHCFTHISAVGSDSPGKQELDPDILRRASLVLVDSQRQCEKLGELQHAPNPAVRAIEIGEYCEKPVAFDSAGITLADFTGLGVEDLYIAESCYLGAL
jgi:ornithine cyclodeaminase